MEITQRQLSLQKIIKSQESRIKELESQLLRIPDVGKLEASLKQALTTIDLKERQLLAARQEISRSKIDLRQSREVFRVTKQHEKQTLAAENGHLQEKLRELQNKYHQEAERSQLQLSKLLRENTFLQREIGHLKNSQMSIQLEIEKLQIFYRNALNDLPRKTQTVNWVENLLKFINKYEETLTRQPLKQCTESIKSQFSTLRAELQSKAKELGEQSEQKAGDFKKIKDEISAIHSAMTKSYKDILEQNNQFWEILRKDKLSKTGEIQKRLNQQLEASKTAAQKQKADLSKKIRELQHQKRELLLAFTELKNYFQSREKVTKEEVKTLKKGTEKLMEMGQKREQTLEHQLAFLRGEVEMLSHKYQQNIRLPFEEFNKRFQQDLRSVLKELEVHPFRDKMREILDRMDNKLKDIEMTVHKLQEKQSTALSAVQENLRQLLTVDSNIRKNIQFVKETLDRQIQDSASSDFLYDTEEAYETKTNLLQLQELEARKNYEISVLQRNYNKLSEINSRLQQGKPAVQSGVSLLQHKQQIQLQTENIHLKALKESYEKKFFIELKRLRFGKYDRQVITMIAQNLAKYQELIKTVDNFNQHTLLPVFQLIGSKKQQFMLEIRSTYREIQDIVNKPKERIMAIVNKKQQVDSVELVTSRSYATRDELPLIKSSLTSKAQDHLKEVAAFREQIQKYRQLIHSSKVESSSTVLKSLANLIGTLKSTLPLARESNRPTISNIEQEEDSKRKTVSKSVSQMTLQKRLKEIQSARLREKNECLQIIQKLTQQVKKIESRKNSEKWVIEYNAKTEAMLREAVEIILAQIQQASAKTGRQAQLNAITKRALQDLENKLKEALLENEGLLKEMKLLSNASKISKSRGPGDYSKQGLEAHGR